MSETEQTFNPGSDAALERGCKCPVLDNGHGRGHLGDGEQFGWWIQQDCPLHGSRLRTWEETMVRQPRESEDE
jgi:hypothetical protein